MTPRPPLFGRAFNHAIDRTRTVGPPAFYRTLSRIQDQLAWDSYIVVLLEARNPIPLDGSIFCNGDNSSYAIPIGAAWAATVTILELTEVT